MIKEFFQSTSAEEMRAFGASFAYRARPGVIALSGDLGAGKTTFAQGFLAGMGARPPFTSPTFVIMKQYELSIPRNGIKRVYHVDAYRVESDALAAQGFDEWMTDIEGVVLLEWPERVSSLVPSEAIQITFFVEGKSRRVEIEKN